MAGQGGGVISAHKMAGEEGGVNRADPIKLYEQELRKALWAARTIGSLHASSRFLALCSLTWATVVLLGAFASSLLPLDFAFIASLLLLESARLASASFFTRLLNRALRRLSQDPKQINHGEDGQYSRARLARVISLFLQFCLIFPSVILPALYVSAPHYANPPTTPNLQSSVRIFYSLVMINSFVASVNLICSTLAFFSLGKREYSIIRYYDKVLENAMSSGVVQADNFEFFGFAYEMLGGEFRRNVQPEAVAKNHKQLIQYLYAHRLGVDFLQIYLDVEDAYVRQAASNMVGFWADSTWGVGLAEVRLPEEVLTKLADKLGTGQVGWAVANSFGALARKPRALVVADTHTSQGKSLLNRLAELIDDSSSRSLALVRALVAVYEQLCVNEQQPPMPFTNPDILLPKLKKLASISKRHRLRVQAAYLLLMMQNACDSSVIKAIDPTQDDYWFQSEKSMLQLLRALGDLSLFPFSDRPVAGRPPIKICEDTDISSPAWAQLSPPQPALKRDVN